MYRVRRDRGTYLTVIGLLALLVWWHVSHAGTFVIGNADGSFESGLGGMTTAGDVQLVSSLGILRPTQGSQAALLTTAPDTGAALTDVDESLLRIEHITIPAEADQLRLDYAFLTNELTPSKLDDRFTVSLVLVDPAGEEKLLQVDTFTVPMYRAPWTGYATHTGFRTLVADVSAYSSPGHPVTLELRLSDVGDGRGDSAVFLDHLRFVPAGVPQACANYTYLERQPGEPLFLDGSCSTDVDGTIVSYRWELGDGAVRIGRFVEHAYRDEGVYQATLTVTDDAANSNRTTFMVVVGAVNHAPQIVSVPVRLAAENTPYRYSVVVSDPELAFGDRVTFALTEAPDGMTIEPATGMVTWTPTAVSPRQHAVTIQVSDSLGLSNTQSFTVTVGPEVYIIAADDTSRLYVARSNGDGTFGEFHVVEDTGDHTQGGAAIADFDGDGDFDFISGHAQHPSLYLYYYEKRGAGFAAPVFLGTVGDHANPTGGWLMDTAAADFNRDGFMDFVVHGHGAPTWLFQHQGQLTFGQDTFVNSDFETDTLPWGGETCQTSVARDTTTAASGSGSMRVFATGDNACLSVEARPANWQLFQGPTLTFSYRLPPGVPVGLRVHVSGYGWLSLGGSPAASPGPHPMVPAVQLIDDDQWRTATVDLYHRIRQQWPEAGQITAFAWWTDHNAPANVQFWFDDFRVTRRTYISGFESRLLPDTGAYGRGMDAADVNGDDNPDIVRGRWPDGQVHLYAGDRAGQFTVSSIADAGADPFGVALADFDGDGVVDLIANEGASGGPHFFKGHGDGTFQAGVYIASLDTNRLSGYATYDVDNDGNADLVVVNYAGRQVLYYPGHGDATFGTPVQIGMTQAFTLGIGAPAGRVVGQPFGVITVDSDAIQQGDPANFDASASYDDGHIVSFDWDFGDGVTAGGATVSHRFTTEGVYLLRLTVVDDEGKRDRRTRRMTVKGAPPTAVLHGPALVDESAASLGQWAVWFDATGSTDDVGIASYRWDFGDGTTGSGRQAAHVYNAAGTYRVTLTVTDHAAQTDTTVLTTTVMANNPPLANHGGPYMLTEADAYGGKWRFSLDATGSMDDHGIQRYTVDFGDGTRYTTGFSQGRQGSYFAAGTDLYGYSVSNARPGRIMATQDATAVELIDLTTRDVIAANTLNRFETWEVFPGAGVAFKVKATKPVLALENSSLFSGYSAFVPSLDTHPVGHEFLFQRQTHDPFFVFAIEDTLVRFFDVSGKRVAERAMLAGTYWEPVALGNSAYHVVASGKIAMQISGANAYTTVPAATGEAVGHRFTFATHAWLSGAFAVLPYEAATVEVIDLDSGALLYTRTLTPGEVWFQSGVGTRRLRLGSTGEVEVWAGDTEGGTGILDLGDGISVTAGRGGKAFYLHTLRDGMVIFAPNPNTMIDIDYGDRVVTLNRDEFLHLRPGDFLSGAGVHRITASEPVVIQTLGGANGFNDYGTYLGGVSGRHRYTSPGTYPLTLTVTDRAGQTHSSTTTVEVQAGAPPVATIQAPSVADETFASGGQWTVPFDATGSRDDVGIYSYVWDFGDGTTGTGIKPEHTYTKPGTYSVTLTVTDHAGQQASTTFPVVVTATDPPLADTGGPYVLGEQAASFGLWTAIFDGTGSTDDVGIMTYAWDFGDGLADDFDHGNADDWRPVTGVWEVRDGALHQIDAGLDRPVVLSDKEAARDVTVEADARVVEGHGQEAILVFRALDEANRYEFHIRGRGLNDALLERHLNGMPTTLIQHRLPFAVVPQVVYRLKAELRGSRIRLYVDGNLIIETTDTSFPRGRVGFATYKTHVDFDNLVVTHTGDGPTPTHTYTGEGTYNVSLTITDRALQSHTATTTVTIGKGAAPVADAGGPYTVERGGRLTFSARHATDDVHVEQHHWDFGDGTTGTKPGPVHVYEVEGTYTAALTVVDRVLQSDTAATTVNVITGSPPVADAGGPYQGAVNGPAVFFDGSRSQDDYGITNHFWDLDASVDTDGDGDPGNDRDAVGSKVIHTYTAEGTFTAILTVIDGPGQTATDTATVTIVGNLPPRVVTVPWVSADPAVPHETFNGKATTLKGVVYDADPVTYTWDFGDGTTSGPLPVSPHGHHRLEATHAYPNVPAGTPFVATLTVTDSRGHTGSDTYHVMVKSQSFNTEVNVAIDEALWYAHKQQNRASGQWRQRDEVATTASMVNAFEANTHVPTGDPGEDPYVETARLGLGYILNRLTPEPVSPQPAGNPDTNGNGIGIRVNETAYPYQGGMVMDALIASGAPLLMANHGRADVVGRRYIDLVQDMVDAYAYGQYDHDGTSRGGWRYVWNQFPDNSASQWGAIGLIPAERNFGIRIPEFIKPENLHWLDFSQDAGSGHFGYIGTVGAWGTVATTASGMVQLAMDEVPRTDPRWTQAEHYLRGLWETPSGNDALLNNVYAMFALSKAMRLAHPAQVTRLCARGCTAPPLDWYGDPVLGLAHSVLVKQDADGGWTQPPGLIGSLFWERNLVSAWAILILTKSLFEVAPEADAGPDRVWGVDVPLPFDGTGSFHPDPFGHLVLYEWDVDGDGRFDIRSDSPTASFTYTHTDYPTAWLPREITVTLRVTGNRGETDTDTVRITVAESPHPPLADIGGPYTCTAGIPCRLESRSSFDIDPTDIIVAYDWELDGVGVPDFNEAFGRTVTYVFPSTGTFNVGLRVTDNGVMNDLNGDGVVDDHERLSDYDFTTVTVVENLPPLANAGGPYTVPEGSALILDGSGSSDPNGDVLTYAWDLNNDGVFGDATGSTPSVIFPDDGSFTVTLQVSDSAEIHTDTTVITVTNVVPTAEAGAEQTVGEDQLVTLDASGSTDPGADVLMFQWLQIAGPSVVLDLTDPVQPTFTAPTVTSGGAILVFQLTVSDGELSSVPVQVAIRVLNRNDPPVCALAQASPARLWPPNHTLIPIGIANVTDPDNDPLTLTVISVSQDEPVNGLGDGDTGPDAVLQGAGALVRRERSGQGNGRIYTITFQADDGFNVPCTGTVTACVPHDKKATCTDDGQRFDALQP